MRPFVQSDEVLIDVAGAHGQIDKRYRAISTLLLQSLSQPDGQQLVEHVGVRPPAPTLRGTSPGQHNSNFVVFLCGRRFEAEVDKKTVLTAHDIEIVVKARPRLPTALSFVGLNVAAGE